MATAQDVGTLGIHHAQYAKSVQRVEEHMPNDGPLPACAWGVRQDSGLWGSLGALIVW